MVSFIKKLIALAGLLSAVTCLAITVPFRSGFHLRDSVEELTITYRTINNLILLPIRINDTLQVNLILDTGTRNMVLFGKRFLKYFQFEPIKPVQFSGLGSGSPVFGKLSINNEVTIHSIISIDAPVVVVPDKNLFSSFTNVHGVIGYELFLNLEIEINHSKKQITFRPPKHTTHSLEFTMLPLRLVDSKPMLECNFVFLDGINHGCELMIDTGSNLNLLLKTTNPSFFANEGTEKILGRGFNGNVEGVEVLTKRLLLTGMEIKSVPTGIMVSSHFNYASIGMGVLKDYIVVINYCRGFVGMRINEATP